MFTSVELNTTRPGLMPDLMSLAKNEKVVFCLISNQRVGLCMVSELQLITLECVGV